MLPRVRINLVFECLVLAALAAWSFHAFAEDRPSLPTKVIVRTGECGGATAQESYATPLASEGGDVLIARAPDLTLNARLCASVLEPVKVDLKLIGMDHALGLAAYELPGGISTFSEQGLDHLHYDVSQTPMGTPVRMTATERHFLPFLSDGTAPYWEVIPRAKKTSDFFHAVGAPVGTPKQLQMILTDQTVITLPGQPAKVFRERDLSRLALTPFVYYRLGISPGAARAWVAELRAGKKSPLQLLEPTKNGHTVWQLFGHRVEETCFAAGAATGADNVPVGGINPVGVGGLEDALSSCRFHFRASPGATTIPGLSERLPAEGARVFLAYRRVFMGEAARLELQSVQNIQHLLQLFHAPRPRNLPAWTFLVEQDFLKAAQNPLLLDLRTKAVAAKDAAVEFFQKEYGDPMILRRAFVLASLLNSHDHAAVSHADLMQLQTDLATDLPDHLRELDLRGPGERSAFLKAKKELLAKFQALCDARKRLP